MCFAGFSLATAAPGFAAMFVASCFSLAQVSSNAFGQGEREAGYRSFLLGTYPEQSCYSWYGDLKVADQYMDAITHTLHVFVLVP